MYFFFPVIQSARKRFTRKKFPRFVVLLDFSTNFVAVNLCSVLLFIVYINVFIFVLIKGVEIEQGEI